MGGCTSSPKEASTPGGQLRQRDNTHQYDLDKSSAESVNSNRTVTMMERLQAPVTQKISKVYRIGKRSGGYLCVLYPGFNYFGRKACQDAYVAAHINCYGPKRALSGPEFQLFAVFDGHGTFGDRVSAALVQKLPVLLQKEITLPATKHIHKAFDKTFKMLHKDLADNKNIDVSLSGSTGTCVLLTETHVHVGWAGDSKATLVSVSEDDVVKSQDLTRAHNFDDRRERIRAEGTGAIVRQSINEFGQSVGPMRVFLRGKNGPGLAVSRSLGDLYAHEGGCSPEPECTTVELTPEHKFIILASDGVWDMMASDEAAALLWQNPSPDAAEKLVLRCAQRWIDGNQGLTDDISIVVIFLDHQWTDRAGLDVPDSKQAPNAARKKKKKNKASKVKAGDEPAAPRGDGEQDEKEKEKEGEKKEGEESAPAPGAAGEEEQEPAPEQKQEDEKQQQQQQQEEQVEMGVVAEKKEEQEAPQAMKDGEEGGGEVEEEEEEEDKEQRAQAESQDEPGGQDE